MAEVVLFHHSRGLTPGIVAFADALRRAGHAVHTPDLFDGRTFDSVEEGVAYAREIGFGEVLERGVRAADGLRGEVVYAGFSLGVLPAQKLAQTRPGARGALFFDACVPVMEFSAAWPEGVPVQVHGMDADPFFVGEGDVDAAKALVAEAKEGELFLYPGDRHLFADSSLESYDEGAAALLGERVRDFLEGIAQVDEEGRPEPPVAGDETATLLGFLDYQRATFAWKCAGLDEAGLATAVAASSMTLGGMLKHLAYVEDYWFTRMLGDRPMPEPWDTVDWAADADWDWHSAAQDTPARLRAVWDLSVTRSRARVADALAASGPEQPARRAWRDGRSPSLRWILCHMIEEYARHNGHADLIRESVDGETGE